MSSGRTVHTSNESVDELSGEMALLMRHSSPIVRGGQEVTSPLAQRRTLTPSPLRMHRPRSNPRTRTPMRFESPLQQLRIDEANEGVVVEEHEARRITIRPMAGAAVGTAVNMRMAGTRIQTDDRHSSARPLGKSRKQGPSHRKVRRWNNDNFVNLAAEINNAKASEVLLKGYADSSKYRDIYTPNPSKAMSKLRDDPKLSDDFCDGSTFRIESKPRESRSNKATTAEPIDESLLTPSIMLNRIDSRLRRVVVKAITNSYAASKVVNVLETYLLSVYCENDSHDANHTSEEEEVWWKEIRLLEAPTSTYQKSTQTWITRFVFDSQAPTGGFHRLLLHGLCQFHGLKAMSGSSGAKNSRVLTASGTLSGARYKLVHCITNEEDGDTGDSGCGGPAAAVGTEDYVIVPSS